MAEEKNTINLKEEKEKSGGIEVSGQESHSFEAPNKNNGQIEKPNAKKRLVKIILLVLLVIIILAAFIVLGYIFYFNIF